MIEIMQETIIKNHMLSPGDTVVVGFSGGPDSMALLHGLLELRNIFGIKLIAVHINHMFRGQLADSDEQFVKQHCEMLGVPIETFKINVNQIAMDLGCSFEEAGRIVRYEKFNDVASQFTSPKIAIGQNRNDVVETALINLFRGAGIEGLSSIEYTRAPYVIRPLLDVPRSHIENYCSKNELVPRRDHTNEENVYTRNKIRNELIPYLKENMNPSIESSISRTVEIMKEERSFWEKYCSILFDQSCVVEPTGIRVLGQMYSELHIAEKKHLIRWIIKRLKGNLTDVSAELVNQITELNRTGTFVQISEQLRVVVEYDDIVFEQEGDPFDRKDPILKVKSVDKTRLQQFSLDDRQVALDADCIKGELHIRHRLPGDRFQPLGLKGTKKIKDYFIDEKIPLKKRDSIWLVCDEEKIVWVYGHRIDDRCKMTNDTKNIMLIRLEDVVETE